MRGWGRQVRRTVFVWDAFAIGETETGRFSILRFGGIRGNGLKFDWRFDDAGRGASGSHDGRGSLRGKRCTSNVTVESSMFGTTRELEKSKGMTKSSFSLFNHSNHNHDFRPIFIPLKPPDSIILCPQMPAIKKCEIQPFYKLTCRSCGDPHLLAGLFTPIVAIATEQFGKLARLIFGTGQGWAARSSSWISRSNIEQMIELARLCEKVKIGVTDCRDAQLLRVAAFWQKIK
jgi:hypothetical protein